MVTIYDIAKAAQTSPATVSRVLNGRQGVKTETATRIKKVMASLDFQPRWKASDRNRILIFVPHHRSTLESGYVTGILSGIADAAFAMGFGLHLSPFFSQVRDQNELRQFIAQENVSGSIIISLFQGYSLPARLDLTGLPHVVAGHKSQDDGVHQILLDDYHAGQTAAEYLISLGHRDIVMVSFIHQDRGHRDRYKGFCDAMQQAGLPTPPRCVEINDATIDSGRSAARLLLGTPKHPTAVIITNEDIAAGFQSEARHMNLSIPRDISIIAFEETDKLALLDTPLTALRTPSHAMGIESVKMLFSMIHADGKEPDVNSSAYLTKQLTIPLSVRYSTAPLRPA